MWLFQLSLATNLLNYHCLLSSFLHDVLMATRAKNILISIFLPLVLTVSRCEILLPDRCKTATLGKGCDLGCDVISEWPAGSRFFPSSLKHDTFILFCPFIHCKSYTNKQVRISEPTILEMTSQPTPDSYFTCAIFHLSGS